MRRNALWALAAVAAAGTLLLGSEKAYGRPTGPRAFCDSYPDVPACSGAVAACTLCHTAPPQQNAFGADVLASRGSASFEEDLAGALAAVEDLDSDGDGKTNLEELQLGTAPGDALDVWPPHGAERTGEPVGYDPVFAFRRMKTAFCGASATYDEVRAFGSAADPSAALHEALSACLASRYWRDEALPRLADDKIRPIGGAGTCISYYANFEHDYDLFSFALTGDRDARDLLLAQYHVRRDAAGDLVRIDGTIDAPTEVAGIQCRDRYQNAPPKLGGQPLAPQYRAGMITTQWFLWRNTMGAFMPRGTAAQAYRSYLGFELSSLEGMFPIESEPRDIDRKGVGAAPCYQCHSTLDPMTYAFAYYWGGTGSNYPQATGTYSTTRHQQIGLPADVEAAWAADPPRSYLFGEPLPLEGETDSSALVAWAERAAASEPFQKTLVSMIFTEAVGRPPSPADSAEFEALWRGLPDDGYAVERLAHRIVDTRAFGGPE
jgi:hypothetical protein